MPLMPFSHARCGAVLIVLAATLAALLAPASAGAKIIELGQTTTQPKPQCPTTDPEEDRCKAVTRTTGYQVNVGTSEDIFLAPRDGRVVAWTAILGAPSDEEIEFFESTYGGPARAGISVLAPEKKGSTLHEVVANSAVRNLTDYLGRRVQFPLAESLPVERGQRVALTVPTWAPVFAEGFDRKTTWRASRLKGETDDSGNNGCTDNFTQTALLSVSAEQRFQCFYKTVRLTYSVTMITEPKVRKKKRKKNDSDESAGTRRGAVASGA